MDISKLITVFFVAVIGVVSVGVIYNVVASTSQFSFYESTTDEFSDGVFDNTEATGDQISIVSGTSGGYASNTVEKSVVYDNMTVTASVPANTSVKATAAIGDSRQTFDVADGSNTFDLAGTGADTSRVLLNLTGTEDQPFVSLDWENETALETAFDIATDTHFDDGRVFASSYSIVSILNLSTGNQIKEISVPDYATGFDVEGNSLYVRGQYWVGEYEIDTGTQVWNSTFSQGSAIVNDGVRYSDGYLYVSWGDTGNLTKLNASDGSEIWSKKYCSPTSSEVLEVENDGSEVYFVCPFEREVVKIDDSGNEIYREDYLPETTSGDAQSGAIAINPSSGVGGYAANQEPSFAAFDLETGESLWNYTGYEGGGVEVSAAGTDGGFFYIGGESGSDDWAQLEALSVDDGSLLYTHNGSMKFRARGIYAKDNTITSGDDQFPGHVYKYDVSVTEGDSPTVDSYGLNGELDTTAMNILRILVVLFAVAILYPMSGSLPIGRKSP